MAWERRFRCKDFRKDIILEIYNEAGQLAIAYKLFRCWVSEFQALPDLDANANAVLDPAYQAGKRRLGSGCGDVREPASRRWHSRAVTGAAKTSQGHLPMRALSAAEIIQIWEIGQRQSALDRALTVLSIAGPHKAHDEWAAFEIGERDAQLFMCGSRRSAPN